MQQTLKLEHQFLVWKKDTGEEVLGGLLLEMMEDKYPELAWAQIFTDGSATDAVNAG